MSDDPTETPTAATEVPEPDEPEFEDADDAEDDFEDEPEDDGDADGEGVSGGDDPDSGGDGEGDQPAAASASAPETVEVDVPTLGRMKLSKAEAEAMAAPGVAKVIADLAEQVRTHQSRADKAAKAAPAPEPGEADYLRADHEWTDYRNRLGAALVRAIEDGDDETAAQIRTRDAEAVGKIEGFRRAIGAIRTQHARVVERTDLLAAARALPEFREMLDVTRPLRETKEILEPILANCDPTAGVSEADARSTYNALMEQCGIEADSPAEKSNRPALIAMAAREAELAALRRIVKNGGAKNGGAKPHGRPAPAPSSGSVPRRGTEPSARPSAGSRVTRDDLIRASMQRFKGRQ